MRYDDERGWLEVLYESEYAVLKRSYSRAGVFRGMHIQHSPSLQTKLIRVVSGRIIDFVASVGATPVSIRHRELDATCDWTRIDSGLAHGYYALQDTVLEYFCDGGYDESREMSYSIPVYLRTVCGVDTPILSGKDRQAQPIG